MQSPNQRWLLVAKPGSLTDFDQYDLSNPKTLTTNLTTVSLPSSLLTAATGNQSISLVSWSNDNDHILLLHSYSGGSEYVMLDRTTPSSSINLTKQLNLTPSMQLSLVNNAYDSYYIYDSSTSALSTASLSTPTPVALINNVLSFDSYGTNMVLYATPSGISGKTNIDVYDAGTIYVLRQVTAASTYLLNFTQFGGSWFYAINDNGNNKIYIYVNPIQSLQSQPKAQLVPIYIMKIAGANYLQFSASAQFIMAENGDNFTVYDALNANGYAYNLTQPLAVSQHATWMDGDRLMLTSADHVVIFDYDHANLQTLQPAINQTIPLFDPTYRYMYTLADAPLTTGETSAAVNLTSTSMLAP
jgi:hypothetical protein